MKGMPEIIVRSGTIGTIKAIFRSGPVEVVKTDESHFEGFWEILKEWGSFWADKGEVKNYEAFRIWYRETARESMTGIDNGQVVGGAYLDNIYPGHYATINIFKRKGYLNHRMITAILRDGIPLFFEKYNLRMLIGITRHRAAIRLARRLGFRKDGRLRQWAQVDGRWTDYTMLSILRSEVI